MMFCQRLQFLNFVISVAEISNKHFCKLGKFWETFVAGNFCIWDSFQEIWISNLLF